MWAAVVEVEGVEGVGEYYNGLGQDIMEAGRHTVGCGGEVEGVEGAGGVGEYHNGLG